MTDATGSTEGGEATGENTGGESKNAPWYAGIQDADARGFAELKGWDSPDKAIGSYRNLEKMIGVPPERLLKLPEKADDPAWGEIHKKLGFAAPDTAEDYELPVPEGFKDDYAKSVAGWAKELGIPKHMLKGLAEKQNQYVKDALEAEEKATEQRVNQSIAELRMDWGSNYDSTMALAQRAEAQMKAEAGLDDASLKAWQDADPKGYYKMLGLIGSKMGEGRMVEGKGGSESAVTMSPEAARTKIKTLIADKGFYERWSNGDAGALAELKSLNAIVAGAGKS